MDKKNLNPLIKFRVEAITSHGIFYREYKAKSGTEAKEMMLKLLTLAGINDSIINVQLIDVIHNGVMG